MSIRYVHMEQIKKQINQSDDGGERIMLYVHESNFDTKIETNYHEKASELKTFKEDFYEPFRKAMFSIDFTGPSMEDFKEATKLINAYYKNLAEFIKNNGITSQSKLESTLLEELSVYLFKDIPEIKQQRLDFFNKGIYAGLKINPDLSLDIVRKDVDFCIGKKVTMSIENQRPITITIPIISVEVKTYLDATMFGEVKSSSKTLKSATPNSKAYVLMGYKCLADEHILAARQDSTLDELFVLREGEGKPIDPYALNLYWSEIVNAIKNITSDNTLSVPGRLLVNNNLLQQMKDNDSKKQN